MLLFIPRIGDNVTRLSQMAPLLEALSDPHTEFDVIPGAGGAHPRASALPSDPAAALRQVEERDPRVAVLLEPMLGVTLCPTMIEASQKINVIPARASCTWTAGCRPSWARRTRAGASRGSWARRT